MSIFTVWIEISFDNTGNVWLKIEILFVLVDAINVIFVRKWSDVFTELQDSYFFYSKTRVANNHKEIQYQPVLWRVFTILKVH